MNPYFSVLIPAYNQVGKMDECIESLNKQTFTDFEVIMVNDGSTDETAKMLKEFCQKDSRFRTYSNEKNGSLIVARFTGMENALGKYIFLLDSDDYIESDAFETLHDELEKNPVDILRFGHVSEPSGDVMLPYHTEDPLAAFMDLQMPPAVWRNCYSASVIKEALQKGKRFYCNMGEDSYFSSLFFSCAKSFGVLDKVLYHYVTGNGMSTTTAVSSMSKLKKEYESMKISGENICDFIDKYNPDYSEKARRAVRHMYRYILVQNILFAPSMKEAVEFCTFFKDEGIDSVYEFGTNVMLPYRVKMELKMTQEAFKDIELDNLLEVVREK